MTHETKQKDLKSGSNAATAHPTAAKAARYNYQDYQYIASLLADWMLQGKNEFEELEQLLRRELCMS